MVIVWAVNRLSRNHTEGRQFMWLCWVNDVHILVVKDYQEDIGKTADGTRGIYNLRRKNDWDSIDEEFKKANQESQRQVQGHRAAATGQP